MVKLGQVLPQLMQNLRSMYGTAFFDKITLQLSEVTGLDYVFIAQVDAETSIASIISLVAKEKPADPFSYSLYGTPCHVAVSTSLCIHTENVCDIYPEDQLLIDMEIEGYVGVALRNSSYEVVGIIVGLHEEEIIDAEFISTLFEVFSDRIGAELEKIEQTRLLEEANAELKTKISDLRRSESKLALHLQNTHLGCITWDTQLICLEWNKAAERIFGYSAEEAIGKSGFDLIIPSELRDNLDQVLQSIISGQSGEENVNENLRKDGQRILCEWYNTALYNENGVCIGVASLVNDATDREYREDRLRHAQKMDALGKLTGGIAHDQNNMLGVISGYTNLLKRKLPKGNELYRYVMHIENACDRSANLITRLLDFSRRTSKEAGIANLNVLLLDQEDMIQKTITPRISLHLYLAEGLWNIWFDASEFIDAVLNLSINAMHALEDKEEPHIQLITDNVVLSDVEAQRIDLAEGEYVKFTIVDNGCGIAEDIQSQIFDPFFTTKGKQGTGLGLSQVFSFIQRANGAIQLDSTVGEGSQFAFYFPRHIGEEERKILADNEIINQEKGEATILVVDDEADLRLLCTELLELQGYQVFSADGHRQALKILENKHIDVLFSDIIMPEMNGYQLASIVKERYPDVKIQLTSGYAQDITIDDSLKELRENLLPKPYRAQTLYERIKGLMS